MPDDRHAPIADVPKFTKDDLPQPSMIEAMSVEALQARLAETQTHLSEPASDVPQGAEANGAGFSPSEVEKVELALRLRHAHLSDELPKLKAAEARAVEDRRVATAEMEQILRLLKAYERIKTPRKRT